jgi:hypothetical protein
VAGWISERRDRAFLAFAAVFFVFHQLPSVLFTDRGEAAIDVLTPFAAAAATVAVMLALDAPRGPVLIAVFAGVLYVHGHGVHLAANSIHNEGAQGDVVFFWDERFSHVEAVLGWFGLIAAFCLAERVAPRCVRTSPALLAVAALVLGWTFLPARSRARPGGLSSLRPLCLASRRCARRDRCCGRRRVPSPSARPSLPSGRSGTVAYPSSAPFDRSSGGESNGGRSNAHDR